MSDPRPAHSRPPSLSLARARRTFYAMTGGALLVVIGAVVLAGGDVVLGRVLLVFGGLGVLPVSWTIMLTRSNDRDVRMIAALALVTVAFGVASVIVGTLWVFYALVAWVFIAAAIVAWRARSWMRPPTDDDQLR
ncbi:hypothetical protein ACIBG8_54485 [Nonomuraea sp. NPDC050556]|uniref:hypothetical protein n=1 Tax=Nonomuraea sp. NPDC050556 TaxID=3364369 RepID=UPI0037930C8A